MCFRVLVKHNRSGFTLLEIIVAMVIIAMVAATGILAWSSIAARSGVEDAQTRLVALLSEAREKTLARVGGSTWGVHLETTQATLFPGTTFAAGLASSTAYVLSPRVEISGVVLAGGGADVLWQPLSGETKQDGTITIQRVNDASIQKIIRIYSSGYVEAQ